MFVYRAPRVDEGLLPQVLYLLMIHAFGVGATFALLIRISRQVLEHCLGHLYVHKRMNREEIWLNAEGGKDQGSAALSVLCCAVLYCSQRQLLLVGPVGTCAIFDDATPG